MAHSLGGLLSPISLLSAEVAAAAITSCPFGLGDNGS